MHSIPGSLHGIDADWAAWMPARNPVERGSPMIEPDGRGAPWPDLRGCRMPARRLSLAVERESPWSSRMAGACLGRKSGRLAGPPSGWFHFYATVPYAPQLLCGCAAAVSLKSFFWWLSTISIYT